MKNKDFSHARFVLTHKLEMRKKQRKNGEYHVRKSINRNPAVQGAFAEHRAMLDGLGADTFLIRQKKDLEESVQNGGLQGIVLPGGESTVQGKLLRDLGMSDQLKRTDRSGYTGACDLCRADPFSRACFQR